MSNINRLTRIALFFVAGIVVSVVLGWWLMRYLREEDETEELVRIAPDRPLDVKIPLPPQPVDDDGVAVPATVQEAIADDLTRIDGIGPKYAQGLMALGIDTFAKLAQQDAADLAEKLRGQGLRVIGDSINDKAWIAQAKSLAANEG